MNALIRAAAALQAVCEAQRRRFGFIGGLAVLRWGKPRETVDVDLTLITVGTLGCSPPQAKLRS